METTGFNVYFDDGTNRVEWPGFIKWSAHVDLATADSVARGVPAARDANILTLKRIADVPAPTGFWEWERTVNGDFVRKVLTIEVHDGEGPVRRFDFKAAWPKKLESASLHVDGNEVAIESLVIAHEGLSVR